MNGSLEENLADKNKRNSKKRGLRMLLFMMILAAVCAAGYIVWMQLVRMHEASAGAADPAAAVENSTASGKEDAAGESAAENGETAENEAKSAAESAAEQAQKNVEQQETAENWKQDSFASEAEAVDPNEVVNDAAIPEEIRAFVAKYPEAAEFAANYATYADQHIPVDITTDVAQGGLPMFLQWDPRWGYETYGGGFMGVRGCGPTCLSMVLSGLTGHTEWNPFRTAQYAEENGYYLENVGTEWGLMQTGATDLGLTVSEVPLTKEGIEERLRAGEPIICAMGPGDFTYSGHFIVLCSVDESGAITIHDPNSRINSERTWTAEELVPQIKILWSYRVEVPAEDAASAGAESGAAAGESSVG